MMNRDELEAACGRLAGAEASFPFGPTTKVFKVGGKMFALVGDGDGTQLTVNLKADPADVDFLTDQFESVIRGYHMNKRHWITVTLGGDLPEPMLLDLISGSYRLIFKKLPKRMRDTIAESG